MIISLLTGIAILLYLLPGCFVARMATDLTKRLEVERYRQYKQTFVGRARNWPGVNRLQENPRLTNRLVQWFGIDRQKIMEIISRLQWGVTLEEVILAKLVTGSCLLLSLMFMIGQLYRGAEFAYTQLIPAVLSLVAFFLPTQLLVWADERAKAEIRQQVPVFFSIVQSLVQSGMPVHQAVKTVARRFEGRLGKELRHLELAEKSYGNWRMALEELAYRWDVDSFVSIAMEISEALKKGVSIAPMLALQIEEQLKQQEDEAATYVNRLSIRLLPFVIIFMGIPLLFLVMGPAFIGIRENL
ncbi:type II secretion system F family protein [Brevibacillus fulvus]|uniref:Tight adherence protein C n=1 Tax=Brevibacillus fulvus TaxID=1125967 RepID=A0A938Y2V6_9BACL|nr:type II secretion system F family protein [Brevibacillus fulvus]MBM7592295.1 tight adherence protein C [Brevibacillus fulvus]